MDNQSKEVPSLRTVPQAAVVLNCSVRKVWHLLAQGALKKVHIGRAARVTSESIDEFIRNGGRRA